MIMSAPVCCICTFTINNKYTKNMWVSPIYVCDWIVRNVRVEKIIWRLMGRTEKEYLMLPTSYIYMGEGAHTCIFVNNITDVFFYVLNQTWYIHSMQSWTHLLMDKYEERNVLYLYLELSVTVFVCVCACARVYVGVYARACVYVSLCTRACVCEYVCAY